MFGVRRSTAVRLLAVLALALGVLVAGAGVSSATDPAPQVACQAPAALPGDDVAPVVPGPAGPLGDQPCDDDEAAPVAPAETTDPGPESPAPADPQLATAPAEGATNATGEQDATEDPKQPVTDPPAPAHDDDAPGVAAPQEPADTPTVAPAPKPAPRRVAHRRSRTVTAVRRPHRSHHITEEAEVYFPPVFVDWAALTPLAPPMFGAGEATRFPGPLFLLPIYQAAAAEYDVPWQILAAVNEIESNFGADRHRSSAGAVGWMQFLPSTWRIYGVDANGDGVANPEDPVDAIFAAARYLHASGSVHDLGRALFSYNHANWYVARVLQRAVEIGSIPQDLLTTLTEAGRRDERAVRRANGLTGYLAPLARPDSIGRVMLLNHGQLADRVLTDPRVQVYACGRDDVRAGVVDRRVLEAIEYLAFQGLRPSISSLRCGHGFHTASGSVSEHSYGAAMDIARINGIPILGHQGRGSITDATIQQLLKLGGAQRPHQIISLMTFTGAPNTLALGDHDDHIHVGFAPIRPLEGS